MSKGKTSAAASGFDKSTASGRLWLVSDELAERADLFGHRRRQLLKDGERHPLTAVELMIESVATRALVLQSSDDGILRSRMAELSRAGFKQFLDLIDTRFVLSAHDLRAADNVLVFSITHSPAVVDIQRDYRVILVRP